MKPGSTRSIPAAALRPRGSGGSAPQNDSNTCQTYM